MIFQPGQKVVCINDTFPLWARQMYAALPVKGKTYTIRGIAPGIDPASRQDEISVYLRELVNPKSTKDPFREWGFKSERFAPPEEIPASEEQESVGQFAEVTTGVPAYAEP